MATPRKTIGDVLLFEYARLIADARFDPNDLGEPPADRQHYWAFLSNRYRKLSQGTLEWSALIKESRRAAVESDACVYCGSRTALQWDHLIPLARGGPDVFDNLVRACRHCNASKGSRPVAEWAKTQGFRLQRWLRARHLKLLLHVCFDTDRATEPCSRASRGVAETLLFSERPTDAAVE